MSLRLKLFLPLLLIAALMGTYLYTVWLPHAMNDAQAEHLERAQNHLDSVVEGLTPLLFSGQLDAIHANLEALQRKNRDWVDIRLLDDQLRQIYPPISRAPMPTSRTSTQHGVERRIDFLDTHLGTLKVLIDFDALQARDRRHHNELTAMVAAMVLIFLLALSLTLEFHVRRPVSQLAAASRELARRHFDVLLPKGKSDEIGALIESFDTMRKDLQQYQGNLLHEIEERVKAEEEQLRLNTALMDSESDLRAVTDAVQDAIIRVDREGRISFWNPAAERLFGVAEDKARGQDLHQLIAPPRYRERAGVGFRKFLDSGTGKVLGQTVEFEAIDGAGKEFPVELTITPLVTPQGWEAVGVVRDISERKRIQLELERHRNHLEEQVTARTHALEEKNNSLLQALALVQQTQKELIDSEKMASLGRLVAGFAHEINTPIGVAVGASSQALESSKKIQPLLQQDEIDEHVLLSHLGRIDEACQLAYSNLVRAADLVSRFKRTSVDQTRGTARLYNLRETLTDVVASLHDVIKRTPVRVDLDCPEGIELYGYPGALGQILTNLIMNSLHHGFERSTRAGQIHIAARCTDGEVVIDYRDTGKGMNEQTRSRLFEPFFTTARDSGGTGLGLFICHNLASTELNGSIRCDSEPGQGTRFVLRYPVGPLPASASA